MRIHAFTVDRGGCFFYRIRNPLTALQDRGHWTSWGSGVDFETWDRAQVLIMQYMHEPQTMTDWMRWCETGEKLCVWDADDDIFTMHTNAAHGSAYDHPDTLPRMSRMIGAAHLVTVTTEALAKVYRRHNPNVVVLRNSVPDFLLDLPAGDPERTADARSNYVIGYTGSASHLDDMAAWSSVYARWMRWNAARTTLALYGVSARPASLPATWRVTTRPWVKDTRDYLRALPGAMDVGIAPLLDNEFNRGKSGIKACEYAAAGIPAIVQDCEIYRDVVVHGETGFLVRSLGDWVRALETLTDADERERMRKNAREHARAEFAQGARAVQWEQTYMEAAERVGVKL